MKTFIKIILVLNLLIAVYRNFLFEPQNYPSLNKESVFFYLYRKQAAHKPNNYFNYYLALTGLETGYKFYAPYLSDVVKIKFTVESATGTQTCGIALNTTEAKKRFDILGDRFYFFPTARQAIARLLAGYMFHLVPDAQRITVTAYAQPIPTPVEYSAGIHSLQPVLMASYSFNKTDTIDELF